MHQSLSNSCASLVVSIIVFLPDADLWLPFEIRWRKSVMRFFPLMGVVWYSVPSLIVALIRFQFG